MGKHGFFTEMFLMLRSIMRNGWPNWAVGYDTLIVINRLVNFISERVFGKGKISLSKKIKNSVKSAVKFINNFEETAADIGICNQYKYVVCGHIHQPEMRLVENQDGAIMYLNSGDWIEKSYFFGICKWPMDYL